MFLGYPVWILPEPLVGAVDRTEEGLCVQEWTRTSGGISRLDVQVRTDRPRLAKFVRNFIPCANLTFAYVLCLNSSDSEETFLRFSKLISLNLSWTMDH
jgi:hypothetical protein